MPDLNSVRKQLFVGLVIAIVGGCAGGYITSKIEADKRAAEFRGEVAKTELESIGKVARVLSVYESNAVRAYHAVDRRKFSIDVLELDSTEINRDVRSALAAADTAREAFFGELREQSYNLSDEEHERLLVRYAASLSISDIARRALEQDTIYDYSRKLASEFIQDIEASRETAQETSERLLKRDRSR